MKKHHKQMITYSGLFFGLLLFFVATYRYYPGLQLSVHGEVEGEVEARIAWDFGYGFNRFDTVDFLLTAAVESPSPLGQVTVEAVGMKNRRSEGYGVTLLISETHLGNELDLRVAGKHAWGDRAADQHGRGGRWLFMAAGAKITLNIAEPTLEITVLPSFQSGIAKVTSSQGLQRYYDCSGHEPYGSPRVYVFGFAPRGEIAHALNQYRLDLANQLALPKQHIKQIQLTTFPEKTIQQVIPASSLTIRLGKKPAAAPLPAYRLVKLIVNGQRVEWDDHRLLLSRPSLGNGALLEPLEDYLVFQGNIYSFELQVKNQDRADIPFIFWLDGVEKEIETRFNTHHQITTYQANSRYLPAGAVISSLTIHDPESREHRLDFPENNANTLTVGKAQLAKINQAQFHPGLFAIQALTAGVITFLVYWLAHLAIVRRMGSLREGCRLLFYDHKHWFFWAIFLLGLAVNMLFLAAEWPGNLTPDSITVHKEVKWMQFSNHHPYIYSFLLLGLYNLFDSPTTLIVGQMLLFHALAGMFFCILYQQGLSLFLLFPLALLHILSIPINLFNISLWKDIPFTTLILFWALLISFIAYRKYYCGKETILNRRDAILLGLLFFLLLTLRHNGIIFLPMIALFIGLFFWQQKGFLAVFFACSALLLVTYSSLTPLAASAKKENSNFARHVLSSRSGKMLSVLDGEKKYYLEDYLSDRLRLFVATLGTSPVADTWFSDTHNPPQRWHSVDEMRADMRHNPLHDTLAQKVGHIVNKTTAYSGITSGRFIYWNSLYGLIALASAFLLYKWLPVSALYSSFFLFQAMGMFFFVWPRWRYLYFIYVGGIFLLPIIALEGAKLLENKKKQAVSIAAE